MSLDYQAIEKYHQGKLVDYGFGRLAQLIQQTLKHNPFNKEKEELKHTMYSEQAMINMPLLYLMSIWLYLFVKKYGYTTILFATRDCCHLYKIFMTLFPGLDCHYFHCSRIMFDRGVEDKNKYFRQYVENIVENPNTTLYVDIHGTGERMTTFFEKIIGDVPYCVLLSSRFKDAKECNKKMHKYIDIARVEPLVYGAKGTPIETLNYDVIGTLQNYNCNGPVRDKLEYNLDLVMPYHVCIQYVIKNLKPLSPDDISECDMDEIRKLIGKLFRCILTSKPAITRKTKLIAKHVKSKV